MIDETIKKISDTEADCAARLKKAGDDNYARLAKVKTESAELIDKEIRKNRKDADERLELIQKTAREKVNSADDLSRKEAEKMETDAEARMAEAKELIMRGIKSKWQ